MGPHANCLPFLVMLYGNFDLCIKMHLFGKWSMASCYCSSSSTIANLMDCVLIIANCLTKMFLSCSICKAVSEYYTGQFIKHWKTRIKQECRKIKVVAALLVEKRNKMTVVTLTAGTKHKTVCSYFVKKAKADDHESY